MSAYRDTACKIGVPHQADGDSSRGNVQETRQTANTRADSIGSLSPLPLQATCKELALPQDSVSPLTVKEVLMSDQSNPVVLSPAELHKLTGDTAIAKKKADLAREKEAETHENSLRDAFMARETHPDALQRIMTSVRHLAEQGATEFMVLQFPARYLEDHGRKINNFEPDWPTTLNGFAERAFEFYQENLKQHGYKLRAEILNFPGGMPGDVGIFLAW